MSLKFSEIFENTERAEGVEQEYIERMERDLEAEIERIVKEEEKLGEGRTARVFSISDIRFPLPVCIKVWREEVLQMQEKDPMKYYHLQSRDPESEFKLQDMIYQGGFKRIPRPIAFGKIGDKQVFAMEELEGYTLEEIEAAGAIIENPSWKELDNLIFKLNIEQGVVHRDLGTQNIFFKTNEPLEKGARLSGELFIIDFGLSRKIAGSRPDKDDYRLTIGNSVISYMSNDRASVDNLKPMRGRENLFAH